MGRPTIPAGWALIAGLVLLTTSLAGCMGSTDAPTGQAASTGIELTCTDPCDLPISTAEGQASEPSVAVDPSNEDHMVAVYHEQPPPGGAPGAFRLHALVTWDGGRTWEDTRLPIGPEVAPDHPWASFTQSGDAQVAFLPDGAVLLTGHGWRGAGIDRGATPQDAGPGVNAAPWLFAARSEDGGRTWEHTAFVHRGSGEFNLPVAQAMSDRPRLAVGPDGQALLVWHQNNNNHPDHPETIGNDTQVRTYAVSLDGGRSWSDPSELDAKPYGFPFLVSAPAIADDGTFYIAGGRLDPDRSGYDLVLYTSKDEGGTWEDARLGSMAQDSSILAAAALATDPGPQGTILHIIYEAPVGEEDTRPTYLRSPDGGGTWGTPIDLAEATRAEGSKRPAIVSGAAGPIAAFQQPAGPGGEEAYTIEIVHIGTEGDLRRQPATRAPDQPGVYPGEWLGLAALPDGAYVTWEGFESDEHRIHGARMSMEDPSPRVGNPHPDSSEDETPATLELLDCLEGLASMHIPLDQARELLPPGLEPQEVNVGEGFLRVVAYTCHARVDDQPVGDVDEVVLQVLVEAPAELRTPTADDYAFIVGGFTSNPNTQAAFEAWGIPRMHVIDLDLTTGAWEEGGPFAISASGRSLDLHVEGAFAPDEDETPAGDWRFVLADADGHVTGAIDASWGASHLRGLGSATIDLEVDGQPIEGRSWVAASAGHEGWTWTLTYSPIEGS